ncbi:MAG TPA: glycoside hydrolase family 97 catalytic domain-containing protein [Opitutaceae bacterium]
MLFVAQLSAAITLTSPDNRLAGEIATDEAGALVFSVRREGAGIVAPSRIGVTVDGVDLGTGVDLGVPRITDLDETYPVLGGKRIAKNNARVLAVPVTHRVSGQTCRLEARAYNDGFAWRLIVPGDTATSRRVTGEASRWTLPAGSRVWFFERNSAWKLKSYAGEWISTDIDRLPSVSTQGPVQGAPLVVELPGARGCVLLTEAALTNYSGLRLRAIGGRTVQADFTEGEKGFGIAGPITTPWRVTLVAPGLDALVNSDLITNLCPPPDPQLYGDTSYIKPGRAVWRWWSSGTGTPAEERRFVDYAAELGFEYTLVDDGWKDWPDARTELQRLTTYARGHDVGVFIWKDYKDVSAPADNWGQLRGFLDAAREAGAVGVKLDFLNAESKDRIDFTTAALRLAAERRLMVIFHGVTKPTGEARTFPNEITREGIRGLELNKMAEGPIPASHNVALPYTRFVVGPGDYTPLSYSKPGPTTWAHQLATLIQFTSPMQIIAEHPEMLLRDEAARPALDVLQAIPPVWDETRVLAPSAIGRVSVMARRAGDSWFLSVLAGDEPVTLGKVDLSFLSSGRYRAVELTSPEPRAFARREIADANASTPWTVALRAGDGAVIQFTPYADAHAELQVRGGLPNFHAKASAGGTVRVAYLGGSITAANGWRVGTREFLQRRYPQAKVEEIFAAVPGTGSPLGVARMPRDVLAHKPDLLFVEFAVNDGALDPAHIEQAMEGVVRKLWREFPEADICFVYTLTFRMLPEYEAGGLSQSARAMERVASRYGVPTIAFGFEVAQRIATGRWIFRADSKLGARDAEGRTIFSHDGVHPITAGHALYTQVVERSWPALVAGSAPAPHVVGEPLRGNNWASAGIAPVAVLHAGEEWRELAADDPRVTTHAGRIAPRTWRSEKAGASVEGVVVGSVIGALGYKNERSSFFRVYVDDLPPVEGSFRDQPLGPQYRLKSWIDKRTHAPGPHRVRIEQIQGGDAGQELLLSGILFSGDDQPAGDVRGTPAQP